MSQKAEHQESQRLCGSLEAQRQWCSSACEPLWCSCGVGVSLCRGTGTGTRRSAGWTRLEAGGPDFCSHSHHSSASAERANLPTRLLRCCEKRAAIHADRQERSRAWAAAASESRSPSQAHRLTLTRSLLPNSLACQSQPRAWIHQKHLCSALPPTATCSPPLKHIQPPTHVSPSPAQFPLLAAHSALDALDALDAFHALPTALADLQRPYPSASQICTARYRIASLPHRHRRRHLITSHRHPLRNPIHIHSRRPPRQSADRPLAASRSPPDSSDKDASPPGSTSARPAPSPLPQRAVSSLPPPPPRAALIFDQVADSSPVWPSRPPPRSTVQPGRLTTSANLSRQVFL